jgi:hypothetical protein
MATALVGCGGDGNREPSSTPWSTAPSGVRDVSSNTQSERFFPMIDGHIYFYETLNEMNEKGLLVARVRRSDATHGELLYPSGSKRFEYAADGIRVNVGGDTRYVLKAPFEKTTTWVGEHGGKSRINEVNLSVTVEAGHFEGCIQTLEERLGDAPVRYATTFCPTVGVVAIEAATGANLERAELKSFGEPPPVGPDGLSTIKGPPPADTPPPR